MGHGIIALNGTVTAQHDAAAIELVSMSGTEVRVVSHHYSQTQVSYADLMRFRVTRDASAIDRATVACVRQLMVAQRAQAQKWLDEHL